MVSKIRVMAGLLALTSIPAAHAIAQEATVSTDETQAVEVLSQAEAQLIDEATDFIRGLTSDATAAMTKEGASEAERLAAFQVVLADGLAVEQIGKFMLGEARKTITPAQLERYNTIFPDYITRLYAQQFKGIVNKPLEVIDAKKFRRNDTIVRTKLERAEGAPILVDWRVRRLKTDDHKIINISVNDVSIMLVKREEFSAFIAANGVDALLDRLEEQAKA
ncbi:MAG: ABC transporter substrate-binding protein [Pseudomonadota bacterium]